MLNIILSLKSVFSKILIRREGKVRVRQPTIWVRPCLIYRKMTVAVETYHSGKGKCDADHRTGHAGSEGELRYNYLSLIFVLGGGGW